MKTQRFVVLLTFLMVSLIAAAHTPKSVDLKYDAATGILKADVIHPVKDVKDHYIESVVITVNGNEVKTVEFDAQASKEKEAVEIEIGQLSAGDKIEVKATCSKIGTKTGSIKVE
jgi:hypothetical protein